MNVPDKPIKGIRDGSIVLFDIGNYTGSDNTGDTVFGLIGVVVGQRFKGQNLSSDIEVYIRMPSGRVRIRNASFDLPIGKMKILTDRGINFRNIEGDPEDIIPWFEDKYGVDD